MEDEGAGAGAEEARTGREDSTIQVRWKKRGSNTLI